PVPTSTQGMRGVGCPSRLLSIRRSVRRSCSERIPHSAYAAHSNGAACPLDNTNRSFATLCGSFGSNRISWKKMTDMRSAADILDVGCPDPASVVAFSESMRSLRPFSLSASIDVVIHLYYICVTRASFPRGFEGRRLLRFRLRTHRRLSWLSWFL